MTKCADCPTTDPRRTNGVWARGLCGPCYSHHRNTGTLDQFPRKQKPRADVIEDWLFLKAHGHNQRQAAARMDMTYPALARAIERARHDGYLQQIERSAA